MAFPWTFYPFDPAGYSTAEAKIVSFTYRIYLIIGDIQVFTWSLLHHVAILSRAPNNG